jgi:hypothetical protein
MTPNQELALIGARADLQEAQEEVSLEAQAIDLVG